jgi:DNA-binding MarR family transcriptional regulator
MGNSEGSEIEKSRIVLSLLESVERDGGASQRRLAAELGIALGLVNAYLKRCMKKGWVKVSEAPARRYAYYLTPHGFAEKSRLTVEYLSYSFSFFRAARGDCTQALLRARLAGCSRVALAGASDLAEIATICAVDTGLEIVGVVDAATTGDCFLKLPVIGSFAEAAGHADGVLLTDLKSPAETLAEAVGRFGRHRVFVPAVLADRIGKAAVEADRLEAAS